MAEKMSGMHIVTLIIIAVLTAALLFTTAFAFFPEPEYNDYCSNFNNYPSYPMKDPNMTCPEIDFRSQDLNCGREGGMLEYEYDNETGCPVSASCNMCYKNMEDVRKESQTNRFYVLAALSIILILASLYLIKDESPLMFAITTGIIVGGLLSILIMSFITLDSFSRYLRPFIFLVQIVLVVLVSLKKFNVKSKDKIRK